MTTTTETRPYLVETSEALQRILTHTAAAGLPLPDAASVYTRDYTCPHIELFFVSLEHLTEWSRWTEQPISIDEAGHTYELTGTALGHPIRCLYVALISLGPAETDVTP
jgi:hypothetical protein